MDKPNYKIQLILTQKSSLQYKFKIWHQMNPNSEIIKKRDQFKKEIRKQQIEKKKSDARKSLSYYDSMFNKLDFDSNASNSRSSRFPVPSKNSKQFTDTFDRNQGNTRENQDCWKIDNQLSQMPSQAMYIHYLRNLGSMNQEQRRQSINSQLSKKYGSNCFDSMSNLINQISVDLMQTEGSLLLTQTGQFLQNLDWGFILAAFYFAQNENLQDINRMCLNLMTNYFIPWYKVNIQSKGVEKNSIIDLCKVLNEQEKDLRTIEDVILSHFISLQDKLEIDEEKVLRVISYFSQKFSMFVNLERYIQETYKNHQQTQYISEIVYNFPFLYLMESLAETIAIKATSTLMRVKAFVLINKYFAGYPTEVQSQTQTDNKLRSFVQAHTKNLNTFFKLCLQVQQLPEVQQDATSLIKSSIQLVTSMILKQFWDENILENQVMTYILTVRLAQHYKLSSKVIQCVSLHINILDLSIIVLSILEKANDMFQDKGLLDYFNKLLFDWNQFKILSRKQGFILEIQLEDSFQFQKFEFYLIQCLWIAKRMLSHIQLSEFQQKWIDCMFMYADMMYEKERQMIIQLKKNCKNCEIPGEQMLFFEENIRYFFKRMKNVENVFNPETVEQEKGSEMDI